MNIYKQLANVQQALKAPKDMRNDFGKYNYRSCESVLEAVKPLLAQNDLALTLTDTMVLVGDRIYVKATATVFPTDYNGGVTITNDKIESKTGQFISVDAYAREEESKKGMDSSQVTGAASSYARKYALIGLFCIDDNKDSDATNTHGKDEEPPTKPKAKPAPSAPLPGSVADQADKLIQREGDVVYSVCADCGGYIYDWKKKDGTVMGVKDYLVNSLLEYGKPLCRNCIKAAKQK